MAPTIYSPSVRPCLVCLVYQFGVITRCTELKLPANARVIGADDGAENGEKRTVLTKIAPITFALTAAAARRRFADDADDDGAPIPCVPSSSPSA